MKSLTAALAAHYAQPDTTITTCWKVTRRDGKQFGYTALDRDVIVQGKTYSATVGVTASAIAASNNFDVQNVEVSGLLQQGLMAIGAMTEADIIGGLWDDARVTIFEVNYMDTSMGVCTQHSGTIGEMKTGRITFTTELRGLMQHLQQNIGRTVTPGCDYDLGDANCKVDLTPFTVTGSITSGIFGQRAFVDSARTEVDQWFAYGKIKWLTGLNAGLSMEVKNSVGGVITLQSPMSNPLTVGDTYSMYAGCNKLNKSGATVTSVPGVSNFFSSSVAFTAANFAQPTGFFVGGTLTWTSGANVGQTLNISGYTYRTSVVAGVEYSSFSTSFPPTTVPTAGDRFTVIADASHAATYATLYLGDCKVKFNNTINKGGFDEVPGDDRVLGAGN